MTSKHKKISSLSFDECMEELQKNKIFLDNPKIGFFQGMKVLFRSIMLGRRCKKELKRCEMRVKHYVRSRREKEFFSRRGPLLFVAFLFFTFCIGYPYIYYHNHYLKGHSVFQAMINAR